jgi:hypothetical protein
VDRESTFEQFLAQSSADISLLSLFSNLLLVALLCHVLGWVYVKYGTSISNRSSFSRNFVILGMTIMVIITVVKSSLALSLGLVGALSIVRYRTAIKEPEELAYTFLTIAVGLGIGASQILVTIVAFTTIVTFLVVRARFVNDTPIEFTNLRIAGDRQSVDFNQITEILSKHGEAIRLKRLDEDGERSELLFAILFNSLDDLIQARDAIQNRYPDVQISYFESFGAT